MIKMKITWDNGTETLVDVDINQKLAKYFAVHELANTSAKEAIKMISTPRSRKFLNMCDKMRAKFGAIKSTSNYRTIEFNASVGGDSKSRHLYAEAIDWWKGKKFMTETLIKETTEEWKRLCQEFGEIGAINIYTNGFHLEIGSNLSYGSKIFQIRDYRNKKGDW